MCTQPIYLRNPTHELLPTDPLDLFVPCGECDSCRMAKISEWRTRLHAEMMQRMFQNYTQIFVTLTYRDECLPYYHYLDDDGIDHFFPCFNRNDVTKFTTDIRRYINKHYRAKDISFFIACEFGSHTQRPHLHAYMAFPPECGDVVNIHSIINKYWTLGFIFPRTPFGGVDSSGYQHKPLQITNIDASASYVSKYATKDVSFYARQDVNDAKEFHLSHRNLDGFEHIYKAFRRSLPFIRVSKGFGSALLDTIKAEDGSLKLEPFLYGVHQAGKQKPQKLPMYIVRKALYNVRYEDVVIDGKQKKAVHYDLKPEALPIKKAMLEMKVKKLAEDMKDVFFGSQSKDFYQNKDYDSTFVRSVIPDESCHSLAVFGSVFLRRCNFANSSAKRRFAHCDTVVFYHTDDVTEFTDRYLDFAFSYASYKKLHCGCSAFDYLDLPTYENFECFKDYLFLYLDYFSHRCRTSKKTQAGYVERQRIIKEMNELKRNNDY